MGRGSYPSWDDLRAAVRSRVERFGRLTGRSPTAIGRAALRDDHAVFRMLDGGNFTIRSYQRLMKWFDDHWPSRGKKPDKEAA